MATRKQSEGLGFARVGGVGGKARDGVVGGGSHKTSRGGFL
jgi:hypothetical protein